MAASDELMPVFVYGSLMYHEVLQALLGRLPEQQKGISFGWSRREYPGHIYPVLIPEGKAHTPGVLLVDLTVDEKALFNDFEDNLYRRAQIVVNVEGVAQRAWAYVVDEPAEFPNPYNFVEFNRRLDWYVFKCIQFRERYQLTTPMNN